MGEGKGVESDLIFGDYLTLLPFSLYDAKVIILQRSYCIQGGPKNGTKFLYTNNFVKYEPIFNFLLSESEKNL